MVKISIESSWAKSIKIIKHISFYAAIPLLGLHPIYTSTHVNDMYTVIPDSIVCNSILLETNYSYRTFKRIMMHFYNSILYGY